MRHKSNVLCFLPRLNKYNGMPSSLLSLIFNVINASAFEKKDGVSDVRGGHPLEVLQFVVIGGGWRDSARRDDPLTPTTVLDTSVEKLTVSFLQTITSA